MSLCVVVGARRCRRSIGTMSSTCQSTVGFLSVTTDVFSDGVVGLYRSCRRPCLTTQEADEIRCVWLRPQLLHGLCHFWGLELWGRFCSVGKKTDQDVTCRSLYRLSVFAGWCHLACAFSVTAQQMSFV